MDKDKIKDITEKYVAGESTLQEEQFLFKNANESGDVTEAWSTYVNHKKKKAPQNFEATLWGTIEAKKTKTRRLRIRLVSAAAAFLLLIVYSVNFLVSERKDYRQKEALLSEALKMFEPENEIIVAQNVLYEDEMIIIYSTSEN